MTAWTADASAPPAKWKTETRWWCSGLALSPLCSIFKRIQVKQWGVSGASGNDYQMAVIGFQGEGRGRSLHVSVNSSQHLQSLGEEARPFLFPFDWFYSFSHPVFNSSLCPSALLCSITCIWIFYLSFWHPRFPCLQVAISVPVIQPHSPSTTLPINTVKYHTGCTPHVVFWYCLATPVESHMFLIADKRRHMTWY